MAKKAVRKDNRRAKKPNPRIEVANVEEINFDDMARFVLTEPE